LVATVIMLNTRGTANQDIWFMCLADEPLFESKCLTHYD